MQLTSGYILQLKLVFKLKMFTAVIFLKSKTKTHTEQFVLIVLMPPFQVFSPNL